MNKDAKCTAVYGRRGSGKTTRVKALLRGASRVVVFDPMAEYAAAGYRRADSIKEVLAGLKAGWKKGFKIAYVPTTENMKALHALASLLWEAQIHYESGRERRKITLVVEEMNLGFPNSKLPSGCFGMTRAILQGRHRGLEIIGVTQRPALVSPDFRGNVAETYVLPLSTGHDYRAVAEIYGRETEKTLRSLQPHEYIHFFSGGSEKGRNVKPR